MPRLAFATPFLLALAVIALAVALVYVRLFANRRAAEARYSGGMTARLRTPGYSRGRQIAKAALVVVALCLLVLAAGRPQVGTHRQLLQREGTDVIIALDVSLSMSAQDVAPTRLDRAKGALSALLQNLQGDRVGLVTFAGSATLRFPLTTDVDSAQSVINTVSYKDGGLSSGTNIATALRQASQGFANDNTRSKILVLVSDGEDLGDDAASAADFVRSEGVSLDTIGVGGLTPAPVVVVNPRTQQPQQRIDPATGQPLTTTADPQALMKLAQDNHGQYYDGNTDDFAVQLADEIGRLQKTRFDTGEGNLPIERFQILIAIAVLLLLLEFVLPARRPSVAVFAGWKRGLTVLRRGDRANPVSAKPAGGD